MSTDRPKLLVTARDPATAEAVRILISAIITDCRLDLWVALQKPATELLSTVSELSNERLILLPEVRGKHDLISMAKKLLDAVKPDIVLTGISGPDFGIDEAMLAVAPRTQFGPYALQSYWGDLNDSFERQAKTYLVLDEFAAKVTIERTGRRAIVIGSLKHEKYSEYDISALRESFRKQIGVGDSEFLIGFFGQPLEQVDGYIDTVEQFSKQLKKVQPKVKLLYRAHPKETESQKQWTEKTLTNKCVELFCDTGSRLENVLSGCDCVISAFSTCGYDLQNLLKISQAPLGVPVYLMMDSRLKKWFCEYSKLERIPMTDRDLAVVIKDQNELNDVLTLQNLRKMAEKCWKNVKSIFPDSDKSSHRVIELLLADYGDEKSNAKLAKSIT